MTRARTTKLRATLAALLFGVMASIVACSSSDAGTAKSGCSKDSDCSSGDKCESSKCVKPLGAPCTTDKDCPTGICDVASVDAQGSVQGNCVADDKPRGPGQFGTMCPNGTECDASSGFGCEGAGVGDTDAYCTLEGCTSDSDCPSDYACIALGGNKPPCGNACGIPGQPNAPGCIPPEKIGTPEYSCGKLDILHHRCVKRTFCDACQTNADCAGVAGQVCAKDKGGNKICTVPCDPATNSCPWGNAAECGTFDSDLGFPTCAHRFGSCTGTGKSCEPCRTDSDCGASGACIVSPSKEQFCFDTSVTCSCAGLQTDSQNLRCTGGGCPKTPGGLDMECFAGANSNGYPVYQKCFGANSSTSTTAEQVGCWPPK